MIALTYLHSAGTAGSAGALEVSYHHHYPFAIVFLNSELPIIMEPALADALYTAETFLSGAFAFAKGILQPTQPLKASQARLTGLQLPRTSHSLAVVKGRAYVFGGETAPGKLASNDVHVVILPSSAVLEPDYQVIPARPATAGGDVPAPRKGHTACVIGDSVYIYGGRCAEGVEEPKGRVWAFDTTRRVWSSLDPPTSSHLPPSRQRHAATSIDLPPPPEAPKPNIDILPQAPPDPAKFVPEPPRPDSYGTIFIHGGVASDPGEERDLLNDAWAFDISRRTWMALPAAPGPGLSDVTIAVAGDRLYRYGGFDGERPCGGEIESVDVGKVLRPKQKSRDGLRELELTSLTGEWTTSSADTGGDNDGKQKTPGPKAGAALVTVTTGQGRDYLLLLGGRGANEESDGSIWAYQLSPTPSTAASVKDATRQTIGKATQRGTWAEVEYQFTDASGDVVPPRAVGSQDSKGLRDREDFAAAEGTEVDGATAVVWGGREEEGNRVLSDGWMITVDM